MLVLLQSLFRIFYYNFHKNKYKVFNTHSELKNSLEKVPSFHN